MDFESSYTDRCEKMAQYLIEHKATVRSTAAHFSISKSTVHKDLTERLCHIHPLLYAQVREVLAQNKAERHLRGGEATRQKYQHLTDPAGSLPQGKRHTNSHR